MKEIQDLNRHGVHRNVTHYIPETPAEWEEHRLRYGRRLAKGRMPRLRCRIRRGRAFRYAPLPDNVRTMNPARVCLVRWKHTPERTGIAVGKHD